MGRPETDLARGSAMNQLGNGLSQAIRHDEALVVKEAQLSMLQRIGASTSATTEQTFCLFFDK